jgi:hypothetical protein
VQAEAAVTAPLVGEAAEGRDGGRRAHAGRPVEVEAMDPRPGVVRRRQAADERAPPRVIGVEIAPEAEADVEIGVLEQGARQRQAREARDGPREVELKVEERPGVDAYASCTTCPSTTVIATGR